MRKTKIVCTMGPANDDRTVLKEMVLAGMDVARFNFSHGDHESHLKKLNLLREVRDELGLPLAVLLDTKGPEIRLQKFKGGKATLVKGKTFTLTTREIEGDENIATITYKNIVSDVFAGANILLDDGLISLVVDKVTSEEVVCTVINGGVIKDNKGVNLPGIKISMPYISRRDEQDILFGIANGFDFIAASFVRSAQDVLALRRLLDDNKCKTIKIISKIENSEGIANIDEIISASDGIMIARGDMGVEIDFTELPGIQKALIQKCYQAAKPVITATQMLESMIQNPRPTRAEATDVANAIYDGTSAIMLSGETAAGAYPVEAVRTMAAIACKTEDDIDYESRFRALNTGTQLNITNAVAHAACTIALDINANAILTVSRSGNTATLISKYRPRAQIIACVTDPHVFHQLSMNWGVVPCMMNIVTTTDELFELSVETARKAAYVTDGDLVVITAGVPVGIPGTTNMLKTHVVGDLLISGIGIGNTTVRGRICVCSDESKVPLNFKPGDVLVAPTTSNNILSYMREASAIITEDAGLNSHAAIVGLTLNKAVIIGAIDATNKLKTGDIVTVNAAKGVVRASKE